MHLIAGDQLPVQITVWSEAYASVKEHLKVWPDIKQIGFPV